MLEELLLLIKGKTDNLIDYTNRNPQETLEFEMIRPSETFSFVIALKLEESKGLQDLSIFTNVCWTDGEH